MTGHDLRGRRLQSASLLKSILKRHFLNLEAASQDPRRKVAWCSSIGPCELLIGMGFEVFFPENHGALLGAARWAADMIPTAVAAGYSPDVCSYMTSDLGAHMKGVTPFTRAYGLAAVPRPDLLLVNNNQCREVQDWFKYYAREWNIPIVSIKSPRVLDDVKDCHVQDVASQLKEAVPVLERASGVKFDLDRLRDAVHLSKVCTGLWRRVLEFAARVPAPMTFFDHCIHMAPAVLLRGKQEAVDYYEQLIGELTARAEEGVAALPRERHRIYWDGLPVWGKLRMLSDLMNEYQTAVVASTYCNSWIFDALDPDAPFESMARAGLECFNTRDEDFKEAYIVDWVERYAAEGIIFHDAKTCPYLTNSRYAMPRRLNDRRGIPVLILNGDHNDLRCFSEEQSKTNIEAFIEQLDDRRRPAAVFQARA